MEPKLHPRQALYGAGATTPALPACEHYAGTESRIAKAIALQATLPFDVTADCEDGAPAGREREQAEMVGEVLAAAPAGGRVGARVHDPAHAAWRDDVERIVGAAARRLDYLTIPKTADAAQARQAIAFVQRVARDAGRAAPLPVHLLIESQRALRAVWELAALDTVEVLDFGIMDWVSDHGGAIGADAMRSPGQFEHRLVVRAKAEIVAAALAHGVVPAHNVCTVLDDAAAVRDDALRARREFGFQRMWSIHPLQIEPIVDAMRPSAADVDAAAAIVLAAQAANWGPIRHAGTLHDRASYRYHWGLLERAHATGAALPAAARAAFFDALGG
ncbi:malyl-CoA lyase [mine drainage metagenome]|uniref:Malyl-CoA lyase n=1 Tax=mine drainage metagenome TaxID=410659 RepID=A0A1J5PYL8_9ZZZZ